MNWRPQFLSFWIFLFCSNLFGQTNTPFAELDKLIKKADALEEKGQNSVARDLYQRALGALRAGPPTPQLGHVLSVLSDIELSDGNYDASVKSAQEAVEVYRSIGDTRAEAGHKFRRESRTFNEVLLRTAKQTIGPRCNWPGNLKRLTSRFRC